MIYNMVYDDIIYRRIYADIMYKMKNNMIKL